MINLSPVLKRSIRLMLIILIVDQVSKQWIVSNFKEFDYLTLTSFFNIVRVHNPGAAFSFLANAGGWQHYFFIVLAILICGYLLWEMKKNPNNSQLCLAHSWVICGAIGNIIDRIRFRYVIDFLDFHIAGLHWPAFNIADSAICIGAFLLIKHELFKMSTASKYK